MALESRSDPAESSSHEYSDAANTAVVPGSRDDSQRAATFYSRDQGQSSHVKVTRNFQTPNSASFCVETLARSGLFLLPSMQTKSADVEMLL